MTPVFPDAPNDAGLEDAVANVRRSLAALGSAAAVVDVPASPRMARGAQATENAWRAMEAEFGLLTGADVADLMGSKARSRTAPAPPCTSTSPGNAGRAVPVPVT